MTDELKEGAPVEEELSPPAVEEVSTETEDQQPSEPTGGLTEDRILELLQNQQKALEERLETFSRQQQSAKDRAISKNAKELPEIRARLEASGGDWDQLIQKEDANSVAARLEALEARISQAPARQRDAQSAWQAEWNDESQKILDAAAQLGISLSPEEYNAAMFGQKFATKGDAYAALNAAILAKGKGESVPVAAVTTEGGEVANPPAPEEPTDFRTDFDSATDENQKRSLLNDRWAELEAQHQLRRAQEAAERARQNAAKSP